MVERLSIADAVKEIHEGRNAGGMPPTPSPDEEALANGAESGVELDEEDRGEEPFEEALETSSGEAESGEVSQESFEEEPALYAVKVDGEEKHVPLDELLRSYSYQSAQDRRQRELAEERKRFEAEQAETAQLREQYVSQIGMIEQEYQRLDQVKVEYPPEEMYQSDPMEYLKRVDEARRQEAALQAGKEELVRQHQMRAQAAEMDLARRKQAEAAKLMEMIPSWGDDAVKQQEQTACRAFVKSYGYSDEDCNQIVDSRLGKFIYDAWKLHSAAEKGSKKMRSKPPKVIRGSDKVPQQRSGGSREQKAVAEATKRFDAVNRPGNALEAARAAAQEIEAKRRLASAQQRRR